MAAPLGVGGQIIYTSPLTPAQLRSTLAAIKKAIEEAAGAAGLVTGQTFAVAASAGQLVYPSAAGTVNLADADAVTTANVIGFAPDDVSAAATGSYQTNGLLTLTDWSAATGSATLTAGSRYYLSATAGRMTTTPPSSAGQFVVPVGTAISTLDFIINIQRRIKL